MHMCISICTVHIHTKSESFYATVYIKYCYIHLVSRSFQPVQLKNLFLCNIFVTCLPPAINQGSEKLSEGDSAHYQWKPNILTHKDS